MAMHRMTPARKAALRKAQAVSARKRRGKGKGKLAKANRSSTRNKRIAIVAATGGLALAAAGVTGTLYARQLAGGGPRAPKINHSGTNNVRRSIAYKKATRAKKYSAGKFNASLGRSKNGSLVVRQGNKRSRQRNRRRNQTRFDMAVMGGMGYFGK